MALHIKKCIVTSSNVFKECAVLKNSANVIKLKMIKSSAWKASVNNNPINIHSTFNITNRDVVRIGVGLAVTIIKRPVV